MTQLRKVYAAKMRELWPRWEEEVKYGSLKSDSMKLCGGLPTTETLGKLRDGFIVCWMARGEFPRLSGSLRLF
jgi:hypothetical protein